MSEVTDLVRRALNSQTLKAEVQPNFLVSEGQKSPTLASEGYVFALFSAPSVQLGSVGDYSTQQPMLTRDAYRK